MLLLPMRVIENKESCMHDFRCIGKFFTFLLVAGIVALFALTLSFVVPIFWQGNFYSIFTAQWQPVNGSFGIMAMLYASVLLAFSAVLLAFPLAFGVCTRLYISKKGEYSSLITRILQATVTVMTAVPTVVYGFAGLFLLTPLLRQGLGGSGLCLLAATLALSLLIMPTLVLIIDDGMNMRMPQVRTTMLALGFSPVQSLVYGGLPRLTGTLFSAFILGFGRASGDTLLPLMLAGNAPQIPTSLSDSVRSLSAHMALATANEAGSASYNSLFVAGALLLCINAGISLGVRAIRSKNKKAQEQYYA